jgi:SAM-dependent methyltransferase
MNPAEFQNIDATEETLWWFQGMDRMLWDFLEAHGDFVAGRCLEVGCGTGRISSQLLERYPECTVTSMDLAPEALRRCQSRSLANLARADICRIPYRDASFSLLLSLDVIVHLEQGEESRAFAEFARVLAPGGILVLRCSAFRWLRSSHSTFINEIQRFTFSQLRPLISASRMDLIDYTYANTMLLPVAFTKFRIWEPLFQAKPESGLQLPSPILNRALGSVLRLEAAWIRYGGRLPFGQSLWLIARKPECAS